MGYRSFLRDDLEAIERVGDQALPLAARNVFVGKREINVFLHGEVIEQVVALEDHSDILLRQFGCAVCVSVVHGLFAEPILALPLVVEQREHVKQRRFSALRRVPSR